MSLSSVTVTEYMYIFLDNIQSWNFYIINLGGFSSPSPPPLIYTLEVIKKKTFVTQQASQASASADTSLEDLKKLNPKQSPLDSWDQLHSALDGVMEGRLPADETAKILHPKSYPRARSVSRQISTSATVWIAWCECVTLLCLFVWQVCTFTVKTKLQVTMVKSWIHWYQGLIA